MLKDIILNLFNKDNGEDILFGYRDSLGLLDAQGIEKYIDRNDIEKVYVFTETDVNPAVLEHFEKLKIVEVIKSDNMYKSMKKVEEKLKDKKIKKVDLDDFGIRPIQHDAC